jgi:hypothetical protein
MAKIDIRSAKSVLSLSHEDAIVLFSIISQHPAVIKLLRLTNLGFYLSILGVLAYLIQTRYQVNLVVEKKSKLSNLNYK